MPFKRPTLAELIAQVQADIEGRLPGSDARLRRSNFGVLALAQAGAAHGLYGYLDFQAKQLFPDSAEADALEKWASLKGIERKPAVQAVGNVDFTGVDGTEIQAGTELARSDGEVFTTDALVTIAAGAATVAVTAKEGGGAGNTGAASALTLSNPIEGIDSEATVAAGGLTGGLDLEGLEDWRTRVLSAWASGAKNGKDGDYTDWALENTGVTRAWDFPAYTGLGTVGVSFTLDNDDMDATIIPDAAKVTEIQDYLDARRPRPSAITVFAPVAVALNFTIQLTPNTAVVQAAVEAELKDLIRRDGSPGGTIRLSRINEAVSLAEGETDHDMTAPAADVVRAAGEIHVMGVVTWA